MPSDPNSKKRAPMTSMHHLRNSGATFIQNAHPKPASKPRPRPATKPKRKVATVEIERPLDPVTLSDEAIAQLNKDSPKRVTRYFSGKYLESYMAGYFRFGTTQNYRAKEGEVAGRLGDYQESRVKTYYDSEDGYLEKVEVKGAKISSIRNGTNKHSLATAVNANDYCSCLAIGDFDEEVLLDFRNNEDDPSKKPDAFVTYDLENLIAALHDNFSTEQQWKNMILVGQPVSYQEKDSFVNVSGSYVDAKQQDAISDWLKIMFRKAPNFQHEQEYRLILLHSRWLGSLDRRAETLEIESNAKIAASIVNNGHISY